MHIPKLSLVKKKKNNYFTLERNYVFIYIFICIKKYNMYIKRNG